MGFEGAVAGGGLGYVLRVAGGGGREGELEVWDGRVVGLGWWGGEGGVC